MTPHDRGSSATDATTAPEQEESRSSRLSGVKPRRKQLPLWQETILLLVVALVLAIAIKALFLQAFYIPSESMEPGLVVNDRILVEKPSYWGESGPERGDVVVFQDPGGWLNSAETAGPEGPLAQLLAGIGLYPSGGHLVKRVIGVEGDTVTCCDEQGRLSVNGEPLEEDNYVAQDKAAPCRGPMPGCRWKVGPIPEDRLFVMGDNRAHSSDSSARICRPKATDCVSGDEFVPTDLVVGKVFVLLWPRENFRWLQRPATFEDVPDPAS